MTRVFYGGAPGVAGGANPQNAPGAIELEIVRSQPCSYKPVFDSGTRLYDQIDYDCIAYINPAVTAYTLQDRGGGFPIARKGTGAVATVAAIQARLNEPRRQFHMTVAGSPLLSCPALGDECDAAAGPFPTKFEIVEMTGDKTFIVRFGIRLHVNPCRQRVDSENPGTAVILSHRWTQERDIDIDGFSTLITNGHAIFDMAKLVRLNTLPDDFWDAMVRGLETGFRRDSVQVTVTELGDELRYCLVDKETPLTQRVLGASRIECTHFVGNSQIGPFEAAKQGFGSGGRAGLDVGLTPLDKALFGGAGALIGGATGFVSGMIPTQTHNVMVRVWGRHGAKKSNLELIGKRMIAILLANAGVGIKSLLSGQDSSILRDVNGRWVEVRKVIRCPPFFQLDALTADGPAWPETPNTDDVTANNPLFPPAVGAALGLSFLEDAVGDNPNFRGEMIPTPLGVSRGSWLGSIVAQRLTSACENQPSPRRNIRRGDRTDTGGL